jgi:BMFP domain-containing protein YqiC
MNKEINWQEAHDMQQKLVISYVLENEKLKDRIKELELKIKNNEQRTKI